MITYALILADRFDRSLIAMIGAGAMILSGVLTQEQAFQGVDFNMLALLAGMMVMVSILQRTGLFECLAILAARAARANPAGILCLLALVTALVSAFLNNVTTVMLVAPVTLSIARRLKAPAFPFLFAEVMASNIGGTATLIGDPPNIMIGSAAGLSFNDFLRELAPVIAAIMVVQALLLHLFWGRKMAASAEARAEIMGMEAHTAITDWRLLKLALAILALVMAGFVAGGRLSQEPGTVALTGAVILMLLDNLVHHRHHQPARISAIYGEIDWITLFFFAGLFVVVHGLETTGALAQLAESLVRLTGGNRAAAVFGILWGSAIVSALIDNIPFVAVMIPLIKSLAPALAQGTGGTEAALPLWWALALGACLVGNGTLIGASANLTVAGIAQRQGIPFSFLGYTWRAAPLTLLAIAICQAYLWWRFF